MDENPRGACVHCVIIFMHLCLALGLTICFDFGYCIQTLISIMAYLKAIKCIKVNLNYQQYYGKGGTSFEWEIFSQNKTIIYYYNPIEFIVQ